MEEWKAVINFEGLYEVSNLGNVRSIDRTVGGKDGSTRRLRGKVLKPKSHNGYHTYIIMSKGGEANVR